MDFCRYCPRWLLQRLSSTRAATVVVGAVMAIALAQAHPLDAQVEASTTVAGTVVDPVGNPVNGAIVTLWRGERAIGTATTGRAGLFALERVFPGQYSLRIEGFRFYPRVVTNVQVRPGRRVDLDIRLRGGTPPFDQVDTIMAQGAAVDGRRWMEEVELRAPADTRTLDGVLQLSSRMDRRGGAAGLPNRFTTWTVQGTPFRAAATGPGRQDPSPALSFGSVGRLLVEPVGATGAPTIGGGGSVEVFNPILEPKEADVYAAGTAGGLWSGDFQADEVDALGWWFGARTGVHFVPDSVVLTVGADGYGTEIPRAGLFEGGDLPEGVGVQEAEKLQAFSAFALLDWDLGGGNRLDVGARLGLRSAAEDLHRLTFPNGLSPMEARDVVIGAGFGTHLLDNLDISFRAGFTRSERERPGEWVLPDETPYLYDVTSRRRAGVDPSYAGQSSRQGFYLSPTFDILVNEQHRVTTGVQFLRSTHELTPLTGPRSWVGEGSPFANGWGGAATEYGEPDRSTDISVLRLSVFVRDTWTPNPDVRLFAEGRWTREEIPDINVDGRWAAITGTSPEGPDPAVDGLGGRVGVEWQLGEGGLVFSAMGGVDLDELDPWYLVEAQSLRRTLNRTDRISLFTGFVAWPDDPNGGVASSAPSLLNLPQQLDLPFTLYGAGGLSGPLGGGWTLGGEVLFRRTENMFRRVDLNLPAEPFGTTDAGLEVWGLPSQRGALVRERPGTSRRFEEFDRVFAAVQDGWSEYLGFTVFAERRVAGGLEVAAWYTFSSTEDNLPGLPTGLGELVTPRRVPGAPDWAEGTSDYDVPSRFGGAVGLPFGVLQGGALRARYRFEDGRPYTPSYAPGVDVDADGIAGNEPVLIPSGLSGSDIDARCVLDDASGFASRNECRTDALHFLDVGLELGITRIGGNVLSLQVDGLNLLEAYDRIVDPTLLLVDPAAGFVPDGTAVSPVVSPSSDFGQELYNATRGRILRIGLRWGGGSR